MTYAKVDTIAEMKSVEHTQDSIETEDKVESGTYEGAWKAD